MKLSIAVITMNRSSQLMEALDSCLGCNLPKDTEFVIIDNASTDDTEQKVKEKLADCGYSYYYEKLPENLGVGGGRNYAYSKTNGEYVYMLDDDAVISPKCNNFFVVAIERFEKYHDLASLSTQGFDTMLNRNRITKIDRLVYPNVHKIPMILGFSHFLRKKCFENDPYFPNKYGYEEILPSCRVIDEGYINGASLDLRIVHKPQINKWKFTDERNHTIVINECAVQYAIKKMLYPCIFKPILYFAYKKRCKKHLSNIPNGNKRAKEIVVETIKNYKVGKKIKFKTVLNMYKDFGLAIF